MSFDQKLHILGVIGAWLAGIGTIIAAGVALVLARRAEKVRLNCYIGIRVRIGNSTTQEFLIFSVSNMGERPITVVSLGWKIGRGKRMRVAIQPQAPMSADQCPKKIEYGETAYFDVSFRESPNWIENFARRFVSGNEIKTLRGQIHTSLRHTENVRPEKSLLDKLKNAIDSENLKTEGDRRAAE